MGKDVSRVLSDKRHTNQSRKFSLYPEGSIVRKYFPFKQRYLSVATLRVGSEGIQTTVDGEHITSFAFREVIYVHFKSLFNISQIYQFEL